MSTTFRGYDEVTSPRAPMRNTPENLLPSTEGTYSRWHELAGRVLEGHRLSGDEGLSILRAGDEDLLELLSAAYRVRRRWFGNRMHLNFLINAKSGRCGEDCGYCSQSKVSKAEIPRYDLLSPEEVVDGARIAAERRAKTYCIVVSGRGPSGREMDSVTQIVSRIKAEYRLKVCVSPGLLTLEQAMELKACGADRVNHNLNTSRRFYPGPPRHSAGGPPGRDGDL